MKIPAFSSLPSFLPTTQVGKGLLILGSISFSQWFLSDVIHFPGGGIGLVAAGAGVWWLSKPLASAFKSPKNVQGWIESCQSTLLQFEKLVDDENLDESQKQRNEELDNIIGRTMPQKLAFVGSELIDPSSKEIVQKSITVSNNLDIDWFPTLPVQDNSWQLPKNLFEQDIILYFLPLPLKASDLLWLEHLPEDLHTWLIVSADNSQPWNDQLDALHAQLPHRWENRIIRWNSEDIVSNRSLIPVKTVLKNPQRNIDITRQRLLSKLNSSWQADLELLRREKFAVIQTRTQWIVAGAVFASPVPSSDLLALAVVNGLMIQEMSELWSCNWSPETLEVIAKHLVVAAVSQGVVEWSGHALLSFAKLHGTAWLAAGTIQALSAAYLTRVVGRSMADWMAINSGVKEPDLVSLKKLAPQIVANAAEQEKVDWSSFLSQANSWVNENKNLSSINFKTA